MPPPGGGLYQATGALGSNSCAAVLSAMSVMSLASSVSPVAYDGVVAVLLDGDLGIVIRVLYNDRKGVIA